MSADADFEMAFANVLQTLQKRLDYLCRALNERLAARRVVSGQSADVWQLTPSQLAAALTTSRVGMAGPLTPDAVRQLQQQLALLATDAGAHCDGEPYVLPLFRLWPALAAGGWTFDLDVLRRAVTEDLNEQAASLEDLAKEFEDVWDTESLVQEFEVHSFMAPFCLVTRRSDGVTGTVLFQHLPRFYFEFAPDVNSSADV